MEEEIGKEAAFVLKSEAQHLEDFKFGRYVDFDIEVDEDCVEADILRDIEGVEPIALPDPVIFTGNVYLVQFLDYPGAMAPVMSRHMYDTVRSVGDFAHKITPVVIGNSSSHPDLWKNEDGSWRAGYALANYVALQILEFSDILDHDKSTFIMSDSEPDQIYWITDHIFTVPEDELPPLFRLKETPGALFISAKARAALKEAGIIGPEYRKLKSKGMTVYHETDLTIKFPRDGFREGIQELPELQDRFLDPVE